MESNWDKLGKNEIIVKVKPSYLQFHANGILDNDQVQRLISNIIVLSRDSRKKKVLIIALTESLEIDKDSEDFLSLFDELNLIPKLKVAFVELNPDHYDAMVQIENALIEYGSPGRLFYEERHALKWLLD